MPKPCGRASTHPRFPTARQGDDKRQRKSYGGGGSPSAGLLGFAPRSVPGSGKPRLHVPKPPKEETSPWSENDYESSNDIIVCRRRLHPITTGARSSLNNSCRTSVLHTLQLLSISCYRAPPSSSVAPTTTAGPRMCAVRIPKNSAIVSGCAHILAAATQRPAMSTPIRGRIVNDIFLVGSGYEGLRAGVTAVAEATWWASTLPLSRGRGCVCDTPWELYFRGTCRRWGGPLCDGEKEHGLPCSRHRSGAILYGLPRGALCTGQSHKWGHSDNEFKVLRGESKHMLLDHGPRVGTRR